MYYAYLNGEGGLERREFSHGFVMRYRIEYIIKVVNILLLDAVNKVVD